MRIEAASVEAVQPSGARTGSLPEPDPGSRFGFRLLHVGVAVPRLDPAADMLGKLFGYGVISGPFDDPIQKVSVNFLKQGSDDAAEIELIAPLTEDSPVRATLAKGGGAAYHLCFETTDLEGALAHAKSLGCLLVSPPAPAVAFGGRRIAWFYTPTRQLFELVEADASSSAAVEVSRT